MSTIYDCVVVGGGPGGLTAALYLRRFNRAAALVSSGTPRAAWIPKTRNLIGYYRGISGRGLLRRLEAQVAPLALPRFFGSAEVRKEGRLFCVSFGTERLLTKKIILATGIDDVQPPTRHLEELRKKGLLRYCPICDGFEHKHKRLLLLVKDRGCFEKARFLRQYSRDLIVIAPPSFLRSAEFRARRKRSGIEFVLGEVEDIRPLRAGIQAVLTDGRRVPADVGYVELGFRVKDGAFRSLSGLARAGDGRLLVDRDQRTSLPGVYAVGDCVAALAQISVAAGQAAIAATAVHNELLEQEAREKETRAAGKKLVGRGGDSIRPHFHRSVHGDWKRQKNQPQQNR